MDIYTTESYCKRFNYFKHYLDHMVVFQRDIDIIESVEEIGTFRHYLKEINNSIRLLERDELPNVDYSDRRTKELFYAIPFKLFTQKDPAGMHYRLSIFPYAEWFSHQYDFGGPQSKEVKINGEVKYYGGYGDYVKTDYDRKENVMAYLLFFKQYLEDSLYD